MAIGRTNAMFIVSGDGTAVVGEVLSGKTFYSGNPLSKLTGTMTNNGAWIDTSKTPSTVNQDVTIPAGYHNGSGYVRVLGDVDLIAANIKHNINIFGVVGTYDTEATNPITAGSVLSGKIGFVNGTKITGTIVENVPVIVAITTVSEAVNIPAGYYSSAGGVEISVIEQAKIISANIKSGITILGISGNSNVVDTSSGDAVAGDILSGKKAYVDGALVTGTISSKGIQTYTPTTTNQTIASGQYLSGVQTILGDTDLVAANIKYNADIFGVIGSYDYEATNPISAGLVLNTYVGFVNGTKITGTIPLKGTQTYTPTTTNQTITSGQYLFGTQTILGDADLVASNIKSGVNIFGVTGTAPVLTSLATGYLGDVSPSISPLTYSWTAQLATWVGKTIMIKWTTVKSGTATETFRMFNQILGENVSGTLIAYVVSSTAVLISGQTTNAATTTTIVFTGLDAGDYIEMLWTVYEVI